MIRKEILVMLLCLAATSMYYVTWKRVVVVGVVHKHEIKYKDEMITALNPPVVRARDNEQTGVIRWFSEPKIVPSEQCSMESRIERMLAQCKNSGIGQNISVEEVAVNLRRHKYSTLYFVDDEHKVIYCPLPKSASTAFRHLLMNATGKNIRPLSLREQFHDLGLKFLCEDYSVDEIIYRLENYFKLVVVRHPIDRLVSAHNHRLVQDWKFPLKIPNFLNMTRRYFNRSLNTSPQNQMDFVQFIEMLSKEPSAFTDVHWKTFIAACNPCEVKYNHVIRLETLEDDMPPLLKRLGYQADDISLLPNFGRRREISDKLKHSSDLFKQIKPETVTELMKTYGPDLEVLGYTWSRKDGASCAVVSTEGKCC